MKKYLTLIFIAIFALTLGANAQTPTMYSFSRDLQVGSTGPDVVALQEYLINNGFSIPAISSGQANKGFFGAQTKVALMNYQKSISLPAFGYFGPMTRGRIIGGDGNQHGSSLRVASPNGGEVWTRGTTQMIKWQDNSVFSIDCPAPGPCRLPPYDIKLIPYYRQCTGQVCPMSAQSSNAQSSIAYLYHGPYTIAKDASGFSYNWSVAQTYGCDPGHTRVNDDCHVPDGSYTIQICPTNGSQCDESDNYFNVTSNLVVTGNAPVINGLDAPTTLTVGQTGAWTIRATDPQNSQLSYSVDWGDAVTAVPGYAMTTVASQFTQTTAFTHSYANAGIYTVKVIVRNSIELTAQTSTTVQVTGNNQAGSLKIITPNGGEVWTRGTTQIIRWTSPNYIKSTYPDIRLIQKLEPVACPSGYSCTPASTPVYQIASNVSINEDFLKWNVGDYMYLIYAPNASVKVPMPDGQYSVQICETGTNNCDSSDDYFIIVSSAGGL